MGALLGYLFQTKTFYMTHFILTPKMYFRSPAGKLIQYPCILMLLALLGSCKATIKASNDWAKQKEAGGSAVSQSDRDFFNFAYWIEEFVDDKPSLPMKTNSAADRNNIYSDEKMGRANTMKLSVGGELEFVGKGGKYPEDGGTVALNYLEVPIYGIGNYFLTDDSRVFVGLGPYFAYGIGGKVKSGNFETSSFGENNGGYKRFDAGLTFLGGYQFQKFSISLNYDLGLVNTAYASDDITSKGRSFGISLGYSLGTLFAKKK